MALEASILWGGIVSLMVGLLINNHTNHKNLINKLNEEVIYLKAKMVEESVVRLIVGEAQQEMKNTQQEMRADIKGLLSGMAEISQAISIKNLRE